MFRSKGQTLHTLSKDLKYFEVPKVFVFSYLQWQKNKSNLLKLIKNKFKKKKIAIRSSSLDEDNFKASNAGKYKSFLNKTTISTTTLSKFIDKVFKSYSRNKFHNKNEVLIQEMVSKVKMSGVVFTSDITNNAPYYVINYDDVSGLSDTVTSGKSEHSQKSLYILKRHVNLLRSKRFIKLIRSVKELEKKYKNIDLDIEFAQNISGRLFLLQVRPLVKQKKISEDKINKIEKKIKSLQKKTEINFFKKEFKNYYFGQMPDWNPAEMIGQFPSKLAYSLYDNLITSNAWLKARKIMGYNYFKNSKLMYNFCGKPFISLNKSFLSFLPTKLPEKLKFRITNLAMEQLKKYPNYHDKIEFNIIPNCYFFDFNKKVKKLIPHLKKYEILKIEREFKKIFNLNIHKKSKGSLQYNLEKIKLLEKKQKSEKYYQINGNLINIKELLKDCINYGIVPFSIIARHAFIAKELLYSLERLNFLTNTQTQIFLGNLQTMTSIYLDDQKKLTKNKRLIKNFMDKYGHLRPGTYDINSERYDQLNKKIFFIKDFIKSKSKKKIKFKLSNLQKKKIRKMLLSKKIDLNVENLFSYISSSTINREFAKFIFTKNVSIIIEKVKKFSKKKRINQKLISHLSLKEIIKNKNSLRELNNIIDKNKKNHLIDSMIKLPQLIFDTSNLSIAPFQVNEPNFVTKKIINSKLINLNNRKRLKNLNGKIIILENADPGYDWIFSNKIGGLITKFGGANSHMTIRCSELGIPAAIGCGEKLFNRCINSKKLELDCLTKNIKFIN